jgi:protein gp37
MSTSIEWTDETWNPLRGCRRISPGCEHCYAERQAARPILSGPGRSTSTSSA